MNVTKNHEIYLKIKDLIDSSKGFILGFISITQGHIIIDHLKSVL